MVGTAITQRIRNNKSKETTKNMLETTKNMFNQMIGDDAVSFLRRVESIPKDIFTCISASKSGVSVAHVTHLEHPSGTTSN